MWIKVNKICLSNVKDLLYYGVLKTSPCGHREVCRCWTATKSTQTQILGLLNSHCGQEDISKCYVHLIQKKLDDIWILWVCLIFLCICITLFKEYAPPHIIPIACRVHNFFLVKLYLVNYVGVHIFLVKLYNIYSICSLGAYFLVCNCYTLASSVTCPHERIHWWKENTVTPGAPISFLRNKCVNSFSRVDHPSCPYYVDF
jgi:hypothetical protein